MVGESPAFALSTSNLLPGLLEPKKILKGTSRTLRTFFLPLIQSLLDKPAQTKEKSSPCPSVIFNSYSQLE